VTGDYRLFGAERVEQSYNIADHVKQSVLVDRLRGVGPAIAPHVRRDRPEPDLGEGGELVPPGVPGFRKAMAQQDERTFACFGQVYADTVGCDGAVRHFRHGLHSHTRIAAIDRNRRAGHKIGGR
jgi:hypothetical protein